MPYITRLVYAFIFPTINWLYATTNNITKEVYYYDTITI